VCHDRAGVEYLAHQIRNDAARRRAFRRSHLLGRLEEVVVESSVVRMDAPYVTHQMQGIVCRLPSTEEPLTEDRSQRTADRVPPAVSLMLRLVPSFTAVSAR
jgi:hypothetical protein